MVVCVFACASVSVCALMLADSLSFPEAEGGAGERVSAAIEEYGVAGAGCATAGANDGDLARDIAFFERWLHVNT